MENREMQTSNTEEMVTISRAEYERLQQEKARNAKLEAKLAAREQEQAQVITSLTLQNEWLLEQLKLSKKKLFGRSSEQAAQLVMDQLSLTMNEVEAYIFGMNSAGKAPVAVKAHERKRQFGNVLDVVPEGTPTEVVEHRLPENERICSACGNQMVEIGKEVRRSLMMKPAEFWVREDVYYTYACNGVQREHNKKLNNGLPILHKVPPKRDYGRYFCIMAEKGGTSHGGLTEKLSSFFHAKKQEVNAYGR